MKISVVVAVYNPGTDLDALVDSLLAQTMGAAEFEVIFVDDGSTDGSGERLDVFVLDHPTYRVMHIPNSGWPGRPRNIGIDAAIGTYVYIVDHDDWLGDEALERLYACAERNEADVVVGKEVGHGFGVPRHMFRENIDDAKLGTAPLLALLTPHKLFRRSMLTEHAIRFPEGRRRLEDHVFVMQAYFHARRISILADYACYHWVIRGDRSNATRSRVDPIGYYQNVREVLDIVDRHTEPGVARDRLYAHWYRNKMLHKLRGRRWIEPDEHSLILFREVRLLTEERIRPSVDALLPARYRVVARAVRSDRLDLLRDQANVALETRADVQSLSVASADGNLDLELACRLTHADGSPFTFNARDSRTFWIPPPPLADDRELRPADLDVTDEISGSTVTLILRNSTTDVQFDQPVPFVDHTVRSGLTTIEGTVSISVDLATVAGGTRLSAGTWDIEVAVSSCGWSAQMRLPSIGAAHPIGGGGAEVYVTKDGFLSIRVDGSPESASGVPPLPGLPPMPPPPPAEAPPTVARKVLRRVVPRGARRLAQDVLKAVGSLRR